MRVYDDRDKEGRTVVFEVKNYFLWRSRVRRIVARIPGVRVIELSERLFYVISEEIFCRFELEDVVFEIGEPYGDSDVYWISPKPTRWVPQIETVREAFVRTHLWPWLSSEYSVPSQKTGQGPT